MAGRVVVAEMDEHQRMEISGLLREKGGWEIAGMAADGEEALEMVYTQRPDLLICGMVMPGMDGLELLKRLQELPRERRPMAVVVSNVRKDDFIRRAFAYGASDYIIKPCDGQMLLRRIEELKSNVHERQTWKMEQKVSGILLRLGVPAHVKGYRFLQEAIQATIVEPELMHCMIHGLYPQIASRHQTTAGCVERSIRNAIGLAWERCKPEETSRILGRSLNASYEKPTSSELIALVAEKMRLHM